MHSFHSIDELESGESKTVAFAGSVIEKGDHTLVIEASEPGSVSSMAFTSITVKAINTEEGDSLEDLFERDEDIPYIQEIVAISIVGVLLLVMAISVKRRSSKRARDRDIQINSLRQHRYNSRNNIGNTFGLEDNPLR